MECQVTLSDTAEPGVELEVGGQRYQLDEHDALFLAACFSLAAEMASFFTELLAAPPRPNLETLLRSACLDTIEACRMMHLPPIGPWFINGGLMVAYVDEDNQPIEVWPLADALHNGDELRRITVRAKYACSLMREMDDVHPETALWFGQFIH
jgi:hypothetical protein